MEVDQNYVNLTRIIHLISNSKDPTDDIKVILDLGFDVNYAMPASCKFKFWRNRTALHFVLDKQDDEQYFDATFNLLLSYGANIVFQDYDGRTPIHLYFGYKDNSGHPPDFWPNIDRFLSIQMESKNAANPRCKDGISHLHIACTSGNIKAVEFFLQAGASVNEAVNTDSELLPGYTPIHIAMRNKDKDLVLLLLEHEAYLNCFNDDKMTLMELICRKNLRDEYAERRLHFENESIQNKFVLDFLSSIQTLIDYIGLNQLHKFCIEKGISSSIESHEVKKLLTGVNVNSHINFDSPIWPGYTVLHLAQNDLKTVMTLLSNGADLLAKDANGITPLELCCKNYMPSTIGLMLKTLTKLAPIKLQNGENLADILAVLDSVSELQGYLKTTNVNNSIPGDSPLWPGFSILHLAVLLSQRSQVKLCLEHGADYTRQDSSNMTALHLAFKLHKIECVNEILDAHSTVLANPTDNNNLSHFHITCAVNNVSVVEKFLHYGADPNVPTNSPQVVTKLTDSGRKETKIPSGSTALHIAVAIDSIELIKVLLKFKVDPNLFDAEGFTWIHRLFIPTKPYSNRWNHPELDLWEHPKALKSNPIGPGGLSHFHVACSRGDIKAVEALLPFVTNINEPIKNELTKYFYPEWENDENYRHFLFIELQRSLIGNTPLHLAVKYTKCTKELINLLLENGADVTAKNFAGKNPVYVCDSNRFSVLETLIWEFKKKGKSTKGLTALHFACALKDTSMMKELIGEGEDFNSQIDLDSEMWPGHSPLSLLIRYERFEMTIHDDREYPRYPEEYVKLLLNCFLEKTENLSNKRELTDGQRMSSFQNQDIVINKNGLTAFHVCCMGNDLDVVRRFIASGVDINASVDIFSVTPDAGFTPLHYSVKYGNKSVVAILLEHGADVTVEDARGRTPVHLAAEECFDKLTIFLRKVNKDMKNSLNHTLMDSLFNSKETLNAKKCLDLLRFESINKNDFKPTMLRYIRFWARKLSHLEFKILIASILNSTDIFKFVDSSSGRNIIHYIVSEKLYLDNDNSFGNSFLRLVKAFAKNIEVLLSMGGQLDSQDKDGKTPLHYAVHAKQVGTVKALLQIGADINVVDVNGLTPYAYCFQADLWNIVDEVYEFKSGMMESFKNHVIRLRAAGLYLNDVNEECYQKNSESTVNPAHAETLDEMAQKEICKSYSVRTILTEKLVSKFPLIPSEQRLTIFEYLKLEKWNDEFQNWSPLFKLQHRKISRRVQLFKPTFDKLQAILDPRLPEHCLESIMIHLSNDDWINLLRSVE